MNSAKPTRQARSKAVASGGERRTRLRQSDFARRLWKTSALSTIALAGSGAAHAQDALWQPQVQTIISGDEHGTYSSLEGFIPLTQTQESVVFLDLRLKHDFSEGTGGDVGIGLRRVVNPDLILGGYAYLNVERLDGHQFTGATLGIEAIATNFDAHVNVHLPFGAQSRETTSTSSDLSLVGNQLLEQISVLSRRDYASWGVEGEFGVVAPLPLPKDHSLRLHVGGYHFEDADDIADSITGGKAGFEYKIGNVFDNGASLTFGGEVRHDDRDDTTVAGFARLTIPLGGKPKLADGEREPVYTVSDGLRKRANERVRGDIGVRLDTDESTSSLTRRAINDQTGTAFGDFFFADGENTLGLGTLGDPTTLDDAVAKAGNGFVVALGGSGNLLTGGVTLSTGQAVVGGGQSVQARLLNGTTRSFALGGSDGTIQGTNPANPVLSLGNGNTLQGITVTGGGVGILGNNINGATLTNVTVSGAGSHGASFTGTSTGVNASNFSATGNGGSGLSIASNGTFNFTGATLLSGNAVDGLSIIGDGTYNFQTVNALDNGDDGIEVTSTSGTFTTTGGTVSGNGDIGVKIDPINANVVLTSITHSGGTSGVVLDDVTGSFTVTGATNISNTSGAAIAISNSPASIRFGDVTITNPGADGLTFASANGPVVVGGIVISGLGAGATGLDFSGSNTTFTAQSVNVTGTGAAGSTGIDLSGTLGGSAITITDGGTIGGVDTGVQLGPNGAGAATANANFVFGGGTIAGTTASLDARGLNPASGTYAFGSTVFNGPQLFSVTNIIFVGSAATGAGDGSSVNDLATIATADANGDADAIFVLVNDGSVVNDADGFTLDNGQTLASFGNGAQFALGGVPLNVTGDNVEHGAIQGDPTGNGAATLTNLGAGDTVVLGDGTVVANIGISNGAAGSGIFGNNINGATLTGVTVDGAGLHGASFTGTTTNVSATDFISTGNGGSGLSIDSDGTFAFDGTTTLSGNQFSGLTLTDDANVVFERLDSLSNDNFGISAGSGSLTIESGTVSGNGIAAVNINSADIDITLDNVSQTNGTPGGFGIRLSGAQGSFSVLGTTTIDGGGALALGGISIDGDVDVDFQGAVSIQDTVGVGISIFPNTGTVTFNGPVDIVRTGGLSIWLNQSGPVSFNGATTISDSGSGGIVITDATGAVTFGDVVITDPSFGGIEVSGVNGTIDFGNVDIMGLGAAIGLNLSGSTSTFTAASLDITGTNAAGLTGIDLSGTMGGSVTITNGGVIQDVDTGVQLGTNGIGGATANTAFVFGGGSIEGITASLDARGLNPLSGSYGFGATVFNGPQLFDTANIIFVGSAATGAGDGSSVNDLAAVDTADANLASDAIFVLVNDGAVVNDADGFTLDDGQTLASFGNGAEYALGGVPLNVTGTNVQHGFIQDDPTGNGAATLTNLGAGDTVILGDGTIVANIGISNGAGGSGIFGANIDGVTLTGVTVDGAGLHGASFTGTTTNVSASNFTATGNGGSGLSIAGDGAYIFTGITTLSGNTGDGLTLSGNGSYTFGMLNAAGNSGGGIAVVSGGSLSIANGTVSGNTTFGVDIADAALDVTLASVSQAGGTSGILLDGVSGSMSVSGGTISNVADSGIDLVGVAANTNFTGIIVDTPGLHGISILDPVGGATTTVDSTVIDAADSGIFFDTTQDGADGRIAVTGGDYSGFLGGLVVAPSNPGTYEVAVSGGNFTAQAGAAIFVDGCLCAGDITITEFGGFSAIAAGANTAGVIVDLAEFNVAAGGPITIGTAADPALFGLLMTDVTGTLNVSRLDVTSISGPGLGVDNFFLADPTLFQLEIGAGSIASGNQAIYLDGLTTDITLETVSSAGSFGEGILLADLSGSFAVTGTTDISNSLADGLQIIGGNATITFGGPVTVTNSGDDGIDIEDFGGTADFGGVQVDTPAGDGLALNDNTGTLTFGGQTTITNPGVAGVDFNGTSGNVAFADLDILLGAANTVGLELAGAVVGAGTTISAGDFDVDGGGFAGTLGVDLSGATGTGLVRLGDAVNNNPAGQTSSITNVANGVRFSAATNLGTAVTDGFIFGDGDVPVESLIQTTGGLVLDGTLTTNGRYNFRDATLVGDTSNLSTALTLYYVDDVDDGINNGTRANPGTIAGAMASSAAAIILVNNAGDLDGTIDIFLQPGGATTLDLDINQRLYSFAQGNTLVLPGGAPANFLLTGITSGSITNPGTGTPTLTTTAAAANTITLDSNNTISGVIVQNGAGASSIFGSGINDLALTGSTVGTLNGASLGGLSLTNAAGSAAISTTTLRSLAISGGSVGVNGVDADIAGNGGAIAFSVAGAHSGNIDFDTASTIAQSGAASAVSVVNKAVGTVTFGGLVSASTSTANAVVLTNNAGSTVNFDSGLAITTTTGTGFTATGGGTVNVAATGGAETINSSAGQAIELNGVTAAMALDSVVSAGAANGIRLDGVTGTFLVSGTVDISAMSQAGIVVQNTPAGGLTTTFQGQVDIDNSATAGAGVRYLANLATTASFAGGLDIQTGSGIGFEATGATIAIAASTGIERIRTATGQILNWTGATVAAAGVSFETLATSGVVAAGDAMTLSNVGGGVFNGGNVTVVGTAAGDGVEINGSAATFNFASATVDNTSAHGINLSGANGAVTFTTVNIDGTAGSGLSIANSTGAVTVGGGSIGGATPATAAGVVVSGQVSGTIALNGLAVTASGADAYSLGGNAGTVNVTGGSATQNGAEDVFDIDSGVSTGIITVSAAITHSGATGQAVEIDGTSGNVTFSGNVVANAGAQLFNIGSTTAPTGGTITFSGTSLTATNGGNAVIAGLGAGATFNATGLLTVNGAAGTALSIANAAGTVNLGGVTIANSGGDGIALTANGGAVTFGGTTSVTNPAATFAAVDIEGANGAVSFADLEIVLGTANTTGLDLSANTTINAAITAGDFDVDGGGFAGTLGVNISGAQGTGVVRLGDPTNVGGETSRIINAVNGVRVSATTDLGELNNPGAYDGFIFGDGAGPAESVITVSGFVIDGALPANGSYNFLDATLTGITSNLSGGAEAYYVDQLGTGNGSAADPGSAIGAENSATADVIVLLNTARTGGVDIIDLLLGVHNTGSLQLDPGQFLIAYSNGDTAIDLADFGFVGGGAPANFKLTGINNSTIVPVPGGLEAGKPLLTTGGAENTVTLGAGSFVNGVTIGNTGSGFGIFGTGGFADIRNSTVTGGTGGGISLTNATGATLDNLDINGGLLFTNTSGAVDADDVDISGASALQITGGNANFDFDLASSIANTSGTAVSIANRGGGGFAFAGTVASNGAGAGGISITGATAANTVTFSGTVNLGTTTALGACAGVNIDNNATASTVSFTGGLEIATNATSGFVAGNGGTVNVSAVGNRSLNSAGGAAISLSGVTANIDLQSTTSSGGTNNVNLTNVAGTVSLGTGALSGATGTAFNVTGGTVSASYSGGITKASAGAMVSVSGGHQTGTITFQTGTLAATDGTGLQFNNADGIYNFNGTTTLNGGDAGIDILSGSGGTFTFGAGTSITNPSGTAFNVSGGTAAIGYSGTIVSGAGRAVDIQDRTVTAQNITLSGNITHNGTTQNGIFLANNAAGTITFSGAGNNIDTTTVLGIFINNSGAATIFSGGGLDVDADGGGGLLVQGSGAVTISGVGNQITSQSNRAFASSGGNATIDIDADLETVGGSEVVFIENRTSNNVTLSGDITNTGAGAGGILVENNTGGTITFSGTAKTLTTGAISAVRLLSNGGTTINFTGGGLDIDTTSGSGFVASGGTVTVQGTGNSISTTTGTALNLSGVAIGAGGVTFASTNKAVGGGSAVIMNSVTGTGVALGTGTLNGGGVGATIRIGDGAGGADTGGTAGLTYSGTISNTAGAGRTIDIQDRAAGAGNITLSGNITHSVSTVTGIFLDDNAGGTITFSGASKSITSTTAPAVNLTDNSGATINFTGGGLVINTTSGTGFSATAGGTVVVTGATNTIDTTTGTALNVVNTNIGTADLTFLRISSNGGSATGIILDNTGSAGGLHVTGTGAAGSGGTIANKTGADGAFTTGNGIYLNSTADVRLAGMTLSNFDNSAIRGFAVNGFSLEDSVISGAIGNNTGEIEGAIAFGDVLAVGTAGLTGNSLIDNVNISGSVEHQIEVYNQTGTMNLTVSNSNIHDGGVDGIQLETRGTAQSFINITGNTFLNNGSQAIQASVLETSNMHLTVDDNTITRGTVGNEGVVLTNGGSADLTTAITNNILSGWGGVSIFVGQVPGQGTAASLLDATISGNTITTPNTATNHAIIAFLTSQVGQVSQARVLIDDNVVTQNSTTGVARGILVDTPDADTTPSFHATVTNNVVHVMDNVAGVSGIVVQSRRGTGNFDVRSNIVDFPNGNPGVNGIRVRQQTIDSASAVNLARGVSASNDPATVLSANNPGSSTEILGTVAVINNGIVQLPNNPTPPSLPLLAATGGVEAVGEDIWGEVLTGDTLDTIVAAAIDRWAATGLTDEQLAALNAVTFDISDLGGNYLGLADGNVIRLDDDGNGAGWYVDATPLTDEEFANRSSDTQLVADGTQAPAGQYDLLTTIMHEMGHVLGLGDTYAIHQSSTLMYGWLTTGERRLPSVIYSPQDMYYSASAVE